MISGRRFDPESFCQFLFADIISLKTMVSAVRRLRHPLVFLVRLLTVEKTLSTGFGGPDVLPVLGREVVEGQKLSPVLDQLTHRPFVFDAIGLDEEIECRFGLFPRFGHPDVMKVGIGPVMQGFRHRTGAICGLVHPAALLPGIGIDIPQGSPAASPALSSFQIGSGASPDPGAAEPVSRETFHNNSMDCPVRVSEQARQLPFRDCASRSMAV